MNEEVTLAEFSFTATINAPIEKVDLPVWIFGLVYVHLASVSDSFTMTGRTTLHVIWDMSVKAIDSNKCKFTNYIHSYLQKSS